MRVRHSGHLSGRDRYLRLYNRLKSMMFMFATRDENYRGPKISVCAPYEVIDYEDSYRKPPQILYRHPSNQEPERSE